ncbi:MAG: hypothetical protein ACRDT0_22945 [Pseudonocardiaceae bacterium]
MTERDEQPVTRGLAQVELWAAVVAWEPLMRANLPVQAIGDEHGAPWREPLPVDADYARGAWRTLRWLTRVPGQGPPLPVPARNPDGTLVTAEQLYEQTIASNPHRCWEPEQCIELRHWAQAEAAATAAGKR